MTKERALTYIYSMLTGKFAKNSTFEAKCKLIQQSHLVTYKTSTTDTGILFYIITCDCKGFRSHVECSHEAVTEAILKVLDLKQNLALIKKGKVQGRPRNNPPVGFSAHTPATAANKAITPLEANNLICEHIVQFFLPPFSAKAFVGKIIG